MFIVTQQLTYTVYCKETRHQYPVQVRKSWVFFRSFAEPAGIEYLIHYDYINQGKFPSSHVI